MFNRIMVPVDLRYVSKQEKALDAAAALARNYDCPIHLVSIADPLEPDDGVPANTFGETLSALAAQLSESANVKVMAHPVRTSLKSADLDVALRRVAEDLDIDLIVMTSHVPGLREYLISSNAGYLASHTDISVFVVR